MMAYEKICQQTNTYIKSLDLNTDNETLVGYKAPNTLQQMLFFQNPNFITLYDPDFSACTFNVMFFEELVLKLNLPPGLNYQLRRGANNKIIKLYLCDYRAMQAYQHWRAQCSKSVQMGRCGDQASIAWQYIAKKYPAIKVSICEYNFYNHTFLKLEDPQGQLLYYCP